ncbi:MAG TPA: DUF1573 domain-containing protein [Edaphocola sp.]|nr:DUF1573 domain-containing protein [Edaphocola sp.]
MKKILFLSAIAIATASFSNTVFAQATQTTATAAVDKKGPKIEFKNIKHDYGTIKQGADGTCTFEFKNTGKKPLIISNAQASCGCTVPEWPKQPIAPHKKAVIKVKYDTHRTGPINKSITITSNATNSPTQVLQIVGTVTQ